MITKPTLPPKAGYVEAEVNGKRVYKNAATGRLLGEEPANGPGVSAAELAEAVGGVENAVRELDAATDSRLGEIENALCELDAIMNGGM